MKKIITYFLLITWLFLIFVGIMTLINPDWLEFLNKKEKTDVSRNLSETANYKKDNAHFDEAISLYQYAIEIDSTNGNAYLGLGEALLSQNKLQKAEKNLKKSIKHDPFLVHKAYENLAFIYIENRQFKEAKDAFKKAIETSTNPSSGLFYLGNLYLDIGESDSALYYIEKSKDKYFDLKTHYIASLRYAKRFNKYDNPSEVPLIEDILSKEITIDDLSKYDLKTHSNYLHNNEVAFAIFHLLGIAHARSGNNNLACNNLNMALRISPQNRNILNVIEQIGCN
ncbi:MAG: tetratricopeptide repeat protein [Candidatus Zixiibacteriota bacterium]